MSKMRDMIMTNEEFYSVAAAITDAVNWLVQQFSADDANKQSIKETAAKLLSANIEKPQGKPALLPGSDKRATN